MNDKRYQVFISSTYEDLKEERKAVEETIIRAGDLPVGMESFPAADEEQFDFIKTIINNCDYYVLIVAGRYGSLADDGKSYTEKEYDYAVEKGIPVLVLLRGDRGGLAVDKSEADAEKREKLEGFIEVISTGRIRKGWTTTDGLKLAVREALDHAKATKERPGWIRGDQAASVGTLETLVALQVENKELKNKIQNTENQIVVPENLAGLETPITLTGSYAYPQAGYRRNVKTNLEIGTDLGEIFELLAPHLMVLRDDHQMGPTIAESVFRRHNPGDMSGSNFSVSDEQFQTIKIQLMALNLVKVENPKHSRSLLWSLTAKGEREMVMRRAIIKVDI